MSDNNLKKIFSDFMDRFESVLLSGEEDDLEERADLDDFDDLDDLDFEPAYCYPYIKHIAFVGGPCSGKSDMIRLARKRLEEKGVTCFVVPETATELLAGGFSFEQEPFNFQNAVLRLQLNKEDIYLRYVTDYCRNRGIRQAVILYDRIGCDGRCYVSDKEWSGLLSQIGFDEEKLVLRYRNFSIIHLESACSVGKFSKENNPERYENDEKARMLEKRAFDIYRKFAEDYYYVPAKDDYQAKVDHFLKYFDAITESLCGKEEELSVSKRLRDIFEKALMQDDTLVPDECECVDEDSTTAADDTDEVETDSQQEPDATQE